MIALADVDSDGDLDLIAGNSGVNRLYLAQFQLSLKLAEPIVGTEGAVSNDIAVSCIGSAGAAASIDYSFVYGTADSSSFSPALSAGTLSWADGKCAAKTIALPVFNDDLYEGTESLTLVLENPVNLYIGDPTTQVKKYSISIVDNDTNSVAASGGGGGAVGLWSLLMLFVITLSGRRAQR